MTSLPLLQSVTAVDLGGFRGDVLDTVLHAGPVVKGVLLVLLLFSVFSWAIIFLKFRVIRAARKESAEFLKLFREASEFSSIYKVSQRLSGSPLANVFRSGFQEMDRLRRTLEEGNAENAKSIQTIDRSLRRAILAQTTRLESTLTFLATTGNTTPFIGLFGTVWGIMDAFGQIGYRGSTSLATVAPGISEALVATAAGLFAAVPAVVAYNYYLNQIRILVSEMDNFSFDFLNMAERYFRER
jgi:biopolymer transport protein TolQ